MEIPHVVTPRKDTGLFNSKIGIWLFLASEVMLFGGFFSAYVFLRLGADYPWPERTLPVLPGLINTFILIASSVTVVFAWASLKMRNWRRFQLFMGITVGCAVTFMIFKGIEYNVKFHHQAVRLTDYGMVEGHTGYEVKPSAHHGGNDDHGHHEIKEEDYLLDAHGDKIEANRYRFLTDAVTFNLVRAHGPWIEKILEEAAQQGAEVTLAADIDLRGPDAGGDADELFKAGTPLSEDFLGRLAAAHTQNVAGNAKWRRNFLREAWEQKWAEVNEEDGLGEGAFAAEFPQAFELAPDERDKAFKRWKAGKRARLATEVDLNKVQLRDGGGLVSYKDVELPENPTATFKFSEPVLLRFKSHDVIDAYKEGDDSISLRDATVLTGKYADSDLDLHYVDAIDLRHLVMVATEQAKDPEKAIDASWLMQENPEIAEIWRKHRRAIRQLEDVLAEEGREPTFKDRYRIDWWNMVYYMDTPFEEVEITASQRSAPKVAFNIKEQFMGPDYHTRDFPSLKIPREQILLDSKFTPKWNTYYAIYFTITGLHGLHVVGGAIVLGYYLFFSKKLYLRNPEWLANRVEVGGLFWHFVDLVWIFAFPIFYLM